MILRFEEWLIGQQYREDLIGDFARILDTQDISHKFSRRQLDEHKSWADIVIRIGEPGHVVTFNEAWQEFLLAKQAAADTLD
ncbi:MAG: hypothetical protein L0332_34220 [Chloroflexi bacterium]|nr:hypothetical protein [Chloroflexota bacterium]MCI0581208.1 hypothetical protein [Chloroflexota bacterium]MCI0644132.1 hypothetical protein [Chloroflexota bacterium]MCI0731753.1 hypothetical protein [Chloroflexota bacterium]